ncbi:hypothetical protein CG394_05940 [Gardnerella vaginalis]|uniref:Uncharacterized protein n=1 Tax=Gardnerella vaginalis (strain ATCC 14019 / 317) TaxID=525284 RepID=E3D7J7_GARV3|nr:hypothetical protein HMPREF0421_21207 [Gardnerella vaginalis ATCC 14019]RFT24191.1 hypothetical protein CG394_05940 [Gardnerella vaginalis]TCH80490.1 hypothetical protein E0E48_04205 [Gardnerella vaginalis]TCH81956.1 hypothetical protein E0E46_03840 [Gardnerella vaginalis ATCC 14018 = JCM 11026]
MTALYTRFNTKHANAKKQKAAARCVKQLATANSIQTSKIKPRDLSKSPINNIDSLKSPVIHRLIS